MTRAELRDLLYHNIHLKDPYLTETRANLLLNMALRHVTGWLHSQRAEYLLTEWSGTVLNPTSAPYVLIDLSAQVYSRVSYVVLARRTGTSDDDPFLKIIRLRAAKHEQRGDVQNKPAIFVHNEQFGFVRPSDSIAVAVTYAHQLPTMTHDANTPGQTGDPATGTANRMPEEFQILIPSYAAVLALGGENADASMWRGMVEEQKLALVAALAARRIEKLD